MSITNKAAPPAVAPPVEGGTYSLSEEEAAFFKSQIGIKDDEELKQHIIAVQKKAYEVLLRLSLARDNTTRTESHYRYTHIPVSDSSLSRSKSRLSYCHTHAIDVQVDSD